MIYNQDNAIKEFIGYLQRKGLKAHVVKEFNKGRHKLVEDEDGERYYCVYKREFFIKFSVIFNSFYEANKCEKSGESLNIESVDRAILNKAETLVFIHPEQIYIIYTNQFKHFAVNNNLKAKKQSGEWAYSVPINMLEVLE